MNALKCRTLSARVQIFEKVHTCLTESIRNICGQKTETKEKEACCLMLSRIPGSV